MAAGLVAPVSGVGVGVYEAAITTCDTWVRLFAMTRRLTYCVIISLSLCQVVIIYLFSFHSRVQGDFHAHTQELAKALRSSSYWW